MNWFSHLFGGRLRAKRSVRRLPTRPAIEELESRLTPSTSTNWSGFADVTNAGAVTAVSGTWIVPTVTGTGFGHTYSSAWVGIDGYNSSTVEQTGTEMDVVNGQAQYSAWWEMFPGGSVTINPATLAVHPGDSMTGSVTYANGTFTLTLHDNTTGQAFQTQQMLASAQLSSAEWIVEAPSSGSGVLPLANFGSVTFSNASATINGVSGPINNTSSAAWQAAATTVAQINMINGRTGALLDTTSNLTSDGGGFTVTFGSGTPSTPPPSSSAPTTSTLTGSVVPNSPIPAVSFVDTITVAPGASIPTGTAKVMVNGRVIGTVSIQVVNGVAEAVFTIDFYYRGNYNVTVVYPGDSGHQGSTSNTLTVSVF
jgi:hypothetical protein